MADAGFLAARYTIDKSSSGGLLPDKVALQGLLERIRDLNLTLVSVKFGTPSTHEADKNNKE